MHPGLVTSNFIGFGDFTWFIGRVDDRGDPLKLGRVRVRIYGIHPDDVTQVATEDLPWAIPIQSITSAAFLGIGQAPVGPLEGTNVIGFFLDGRECQQPVIFGTIAGGQGQTIISNTGQPDGPAAITVPPVPPPGVDPPIGTINPPSSKAAQVALKLASRYDLQDFQASAIIGNLEVECPNLVPNTIERGHGFPPFGPPPPRGTTLVGYGYGQWTNGRGASPGSGRLDKFIDYCTSNNYDPQSDNANYNYLLSELDGPYSKQISGLKNTTDLNSATSYWCANYEKPAGTKGGQVVNATKCSLPSRLSRSGGCLAQIKGVNIPIRAAGNTDPSQSGTQIVTSNAGQQVIGTNTAPSDISTTKGPFEPTPAWAPDYPYNKVFRSESGHVIEIDDTPGHERLLTYHRTGTYSEVNEAGRSVKKVVSDNYEILMKDDIIYIDGTYNLHAKGNCNITALSTVNLSAASGINAVTSGPFKIKANSIILESKSDIDINAAGHLNQQSTGDMNLNSGGHLNQQSGADFNILAAGSTNVTGSEVELNGTAIVSSTEIQVGGATAAASAATAATSGLADFTPGAPSPNIPSPLPNARVLSPTELASNSAITTTDGTVVGDVLTTNPIMVQATAKPADILSNLTTQITNIATEASQGAWTATGNNANILGIFQTLGFNPPDDGVPWCAAFVGSILKSVGAPYMQSMTAQDFTQLGTSVEITDPTQWRLNDIVIFDLGQGHGHIGFFQGVNSDGSINVFGGNQSQQVKTSNFEVDDVVYVGRYWDVSESLDIPAILSELGFSPS